jgi:hypothetical protein
MNTIERKQAIEDALKSFGESSLMEGALRFFETLGYKSERQFQLTPNTPENFLATFAKHKPFNAEQALVPDWHSVDFLFQLTDAEIRTSVQRQLHLFDSQGKYNGTII